MIARLYGQGVHGLVASIFLWLCFECEQFYGKQKHIRLHLNTITTNIGRSYWAGRFKEKKWWEGSPPTDFALVNTTFPTS